MTARLCLVEDDVIMGESLCYRFELERFACDWHQTAESALRCIGERDYAAIISDIRLPDLSGEAMFRALLESNQDLPPVIFITGQGHLDHAVRLLKLGAADYITKPFDLDALIDKIRALSAQHAPKAVLPGETHPLGIAPVSKRTEASLARMAAHDATVLITGESGVGKEYAARYLHACADPAGKRPFVAINCGAVPEHLLEAEFFGHEKGAFTGAVRSRKGLFEQAHGGTLFLDEIGEMSPATQVKLLRAIQERSVMRVGGERLIPVDVRLVCATNRDLRRMVEDGGFREDLYYRINVLHVDLPPLRERKEDVLWFARRFLRDLSTRFKAQQAYHLLPSGERALLGYDWPGNLRELHHRMERACILHERPGLDASAFSDLAAGGGDEPPPAGDLRDYLARCERQYIAQALERHAYQIGETAAFLGISRKSLWQKMKKLEVRGRDD